MTCPGCPRPPWLSDEAVRAELASALACGVNGTTHTRTIGHAGVEGLWHVVEWRRCAMEWPNASQRGMIDAGYRLPPEALEPAHCALAPGHPGACYRRLGAAPRAWPVPCWVTTAEEAERWRAGPAAPARQLSAHERLGSHFYDLATAYIERGHGFLLRDAAALGLRLHLDDGARRSAGEMADEAIRAARAIADPQVRRARVEAVAGEEGWSLLGEALSEQAQQRIIPNLTLTVPMPAPPSPEECAQQLANHLARRMDEIADVGLSEDGDFETPWVCEHITGNVPCPECFPGAPRPAESPEESRFLDAMYGGRETATVNGERVPVATTLRQAMEDAAINGEVFYRAGEGTEGVAFVDTSAVAAVEVRGVVTGSCRFTCALGACCNGRAPCVLPADDHMCHRCEHGAAPDPASPAAICDAITSGLPVPANRDDEPRWRDGTVERLMREVRAGTLTVAEARHRLRHCPFPCTCGSPCVSAEAEGHWPHRCGEHSAERERAPFGCPAQAPGSDHPCVLDAGHSGVHRCHEAEGGIGCVFPSDAPATGQPPGAVTWQPGDWAVIEDAAIRPITREPVQVYDVTGNLLTLRVGRVLHMAHASQCRRVDGPSVTVDEDAREVRLTAPGGVTLPGTARMTTATGEVYEVTGVNSVTPMPNGNVSVGYTARRRDDESQRWLAAIHAGLLTYSEAERMRMRGLRPPIDLLSNFYAGQIGTPWRPPEECPAPSLATATGAELDRLAGECGVTRTRVNLSRETDRNLRARAFSAVAVALAGWVQRVARTGVDPGRDLAVALADVRHWLASPGRWWREREERRARMGVGTASAVNRALIGGSLGVTTGGLPINEDDQ